jgi:hypothetical protein
MQEVISVGCFEKRRAALEVAFMSDILGSWALADILGEVPDPRIKRGRKYSLLEILLTAICCVLRGSEGPSKYSNSNGTVWVYSFSMKKFEMFAKWAADQNSGQKKIITALRKLMKKAAPSLTESVKWGNGVWLGQEWPVSFLHAKDDHLQFGFFAGTAVLDPKGLLQGSGKHVKHIKVYKLGDIDEAAFGRLIRQAVKHERE